MKTGIRRKVDDLGRVVIPAGIRRSLGIREGDALEVHVEGEQVVFAKPIDQCVFCGREESLEPFRNKFVCQACVSGLGALDERRRQASGESPERHHSSPLPPWPVGEASPRQNVTAARVDSDGREAGSAPRPEPPSTTTAW